MTRANAPRFLFLQTNQRCNLKCTHCEYWKLDDDDRANYLSPLRRLELLAEFAELGGEALVTCGGEPMLDLEEYFDLMWGARVRGLKALSVVNGTRIKTAAMAERMIAHGPSEITVSVDHWAPEQHDRLRGQVGSHAMAECALRLLLQARADLREKTPIYAMTILSEDTWPTLDRFYEWALERVGVDKLKLNVVQPTFQGAAGRDAYFKSAAVSNVDACMEMVRACDRRFGIRRNPAWLANVEMHLQSVRSCVTRLRGWANTGTSEAICNSYDRNIMVDLYGVARLCFSHHYPGHQLTARGDLAAYWHEVSLPVRDKMIGCKQFCGVSHSVRKESSTVLDLDAVVTRARQNASAELASTKRRR